MTTHRPIRAGVARRRRLAAAVLTVVVIGVGLITHARVGGVAGDVLGDALYAMLIYLLVVCALPRLNRAWVAAVAAATCTSIELLQLTGLPRAGAEAFPPIALVLGSGFEARDLLVYVCAVVVAALIDRALRPSAGRQGTQEGALPKESAL